MLLKLFQYLFMLLAGVWLLQVVVRLWRSMTARKSGPEVSGRRAGAQVAKGTLHKDPVCGTFVSEEVSVKLQGPSGVEHFCSRECLDKYRAGARG
jgi:YHS domain-containing protein